VTGLTTKQKQALDFIATYVEQKGAAPSYADMQTGLRQKSKAGVSRYLVALKARGFIDYDRGKSRTLTILFGADTAPNWEGIARTLHLQNIILREHLKKIGWEPDVKALTLPQHKRKPRS